MANFFSSTFRQGQLQQNKDVSPVDLAIVEKVILSLDDVEENLSDFDKFYPEFEDGDYVSKNALLYGAIKFRQVGIGKELDESLLPTAFPIDRNFQTLPVIGEVVKIVDIANKQYYQKVSPQLSPNFNTDIKLSIISTKNSNEGAADTENNKSNQYNETNSVGISQSNSASGKSETIKKSFAGKYFKRNLKFHQIQLNEGDTILQGRFGQSIRFSGYIHEDKENGTAHPAILIKNGESSDNKNKKVYDVVSEDINNDGTSIQITSGPYKTLLSPTIEVAKEANPNFPSSDSLTGDQLVVNSGRVILSSKTAETFLFSKKTFSIFSDADVTIDTENGFRVISQNNNIELTAKGNKNIVFTVNNGSKIFHGRDGAEQQGILGNKLVDLLGRLIDAINQMTVATPAGPSSPGPIDKGSFNSIKSELKDTLSKINYLE